MKIQQLLFLLVACVAGSSAHAAIFEFSAKTTKCQLSTTVHGTCITAHSDEPRAWQVSLDCRILENGRPREVKLDLFEDIPNETSYTVKLDHSGLQPETWYCTANDGEYESLLGNSFTGQDQAIDCLWETGAGIAN